MVNRIVGAAVLVMVSATAGFAQDYERGWVDVNFGVAIAAEDSFSSTRVITISQEAGGGSVAYSVPRGGSFDVGGGYMFSPRVGLGVSLAGSAHEGVAGLAISVPHPLFFNASATDATATDTALTRTEGAWHIHAMLVAVETPRVRLRVFGGPSYFRAEQETVDFIRYNQAYQFFGRGNAVDIASFTSSKSVGNAWGVHAGADLSVFFNRVFGVGALVRVSRGSAEIADYGGAHDIKVGGVQLGGGLRLKF